MKWPTEDSFIGTKVDMGLGAVDNGFLRMGSLIHNSLSSLATSPDFLTKMRVAFGDSFDVEKAVKLAVSWATGDFSAFLAI